MRSSRFFVSFAVVPFLLTGLVCAELFSQGLPGGGCDCTDPLCLLPAGFEWEAGWIATEDGNGNTTYEKIKLTTTNTIDFNIVPRCREVRWVDMSNPAINGAFVPNIYGVTYVDLPLTSGNIEINFIWVDENDVIVDCDCDNYTCPEGVLTVSSPAPSDPVLTAEPPITYPRAPCAKRNWVAGKVAYRLPQEVISHGVRRDYAGTDYLNSNCSDCTGEAVSLLQAPSISFERYLVPNNQVSVGSSSPGMYYSFDSRLRIYPDGLGNNKHAATFFDPVSQHTFYYESTGNDGNYVAELDTYFGDFKLEDSGGLPVPDPSSIATQAAYAVLTRHNGWEYRFEFVDAPVYESEPITPIGRLVSISNPQGQSIDFSYKTFTQAELDDSPQRALQVDTITDHYGNSASITYDSVQQAGRWVISDVNINSGQDLLQYLYNNDGHLETVNRNGVLSSSYTYGIDSQWQAASISWMEKNDDVGDVETIFLSQDYREWNGQLVNQFANALLGRADGANVRYLSISRSSTPGLYRIFYRNRLMEWNRGVSLQYFTSFTQNGLGFDSYTGTTETAFPSHPSSSEQEVLEAQHPVMISKSGYRTDVEYDAAGNPEKVVHFKGTSSESFERWQFNTKNMETYPRDRAGYVTLHEYDSSYNLIRIVRGLKDDTGPGSEIAQPETTQEIFGYYPSNHVNKGMLQWKATTDYVAGQVVAPPLSERTDYIYDANNRLTQIHKPTPHGQSNRPVLTYIWNGGRVTATKNEKNQTTTYAFDALGRLITTTYPDGTTEQIRRDDVNNRVYRKDRGGAVTRNDFRSTGVHWRTYAPYAKDADLHDGSFDTIVSYKDYHTHLGLLFNPGEVQPRSVYEHAQVTYKSYDYRNRLKYSRQVKTRNAQSSSNGLRYVEQRMNYQNNLIFSRETKVPGHTQREYVGHTADEQTVRIVKTRDASVTFANNDEVMGASRIAGPDPAHAIVETVRDLRGNMVQVFDAYGKETRNEFDALGRQTKSTVGFGIKKANNVSLALESTTEYDAEGNVTKTTDAAGSVTEMTYDAANNLISRKLAAGTGDSSETLYEYHIDGRQKKTILPSGGVIENFYVDCCGHMRGTKDPFGHGRITNLDSRGQPVHQAVVKDYDSHVNMLNPIDANALSETTTRYHINGKAQFRTVWKSACGVIDPENPPIAGIDGVPTTVGETTQYAWISRFTSYDPVRQKVTVDLLRGGTFVVDISEAVDQLALPIAQGGGATAFALPSTFSFSAGRAEITIAPDEKSMQVTISNAASGETVMTALMSGPKAAIPNKLLDWTCILPNQVESFSGVDMLATKRIDRDGNVTRSLVNGLGLTVATFDQDNNLTQTKFDSGGNPLEMINALGKSTTYGYGPLNRQISMTDPLNNTTTTTYEIATGRVASRMDARGNTTTYVLYDAMGRVRQMRDRLGNDSYQDYDDSGNLTVTTDAEGQATNYEYDLLGRRTKLILNSIDMATPQETLYKYDEAGRMDRVTLYSGAKREMLYEFSGVLDKVQYFDPNGTLSATDDFNYAQPNTLRRTGSTSSDGVTHAYVYTERGQLDTDTTTYLGQSYVVDYDYDDRGRMETTTYPSGRAVEYTYTNRGELDTVKWNGSQIEDRAYDGLGRMTNVDRPQVDEVRAYDDANRLLSISNTNLGTATYTYDENSNKLGETFTGPLSSWGFTTEDSTDGTFPSGYDEEDRFRRFWRSGQSEDVDLVRSHIGNITDFKSNGNSTARSFNEVHQLTSIGGVAQTFDANGRLTQSQTGITLNWQEGSDRLDQTIVPATATAGVEGTNDYGYDADNKRIWKKITRSGSVAENTVFIYAGPNCIAEYAAGTAPATPDQEYIYGTSIDSLLQISHNNNAENFTVARNQQWSVLGLLKTTDGSIAELYSYDTFGDRTILSSNGTTIRASSLYNNPYGYTSRRHDKESGLMYFRARFYDPSTGEFLSQDPLEYVDGMSFYRAYFIPGFVDPSGTLCGQKFTNKFKLSLSFMSKGEKPNPLDLGKIFKDSRFPISVSWDMSSGGTISTRSCSECCEDGRFITYKKESISAFMTGQFKFKLKAPNLAFKVKGGIGLVVNGKMKREGPDCSGKQEIEGCITVKISGNVKFCIEDPSGFVSGCAGVKASGGAKNCGSGWEWTGGDIEVYGEACAVWGIYCHQQPIWGTGDGSPVFID